MLAVRVSACAEQELDVCLPTALDGSKERRVIEAVNDAVHECIRPIARGEGVWGVGVVEWGLGPAMGEKVTKEEGVGAGGGFDDGEISIFTSYLILVYLTSVIYSYRLLTLLSYISYHKQRHWVWSYSRLPC